MGTSQKWYESDDDYRDRIAQEANEHTVENSTGSAPAPKWYESENTYRERIAEDANKCIIEKSTGSAPAPRLDETTDSYRDRIAQEANEHTVENSTGSAPAPKWYESEADYDTRVRKEANEQIVKGDTGEPPKQRLFEGNHDYRSRVANEAREVRAREQPKPSTSSNSSSPSVYGTASSYLPSSSSTDYASDSSSCSRSNRVIAARPLKGARQEIVRQQAAIADGWKKLGKAVAILAGLFLATQVCTYFANQPHTNSFFDELLIAVSSLGVIIFWLAFASGIFIVFGMALVQITKAIAGRG